MTSNSMQMALSRPLIADHWLKALVARSLGEPMSWQTLPSTSYPRASIYAV